MWLLIRNRVPLKADEMDVVYKVRFLSSPSSSDQIYVLEFLLH